MHYFISFLNISSCEYDKNLHTLITLLFVLKFIGYDICFRFNLWVLLPTAKYYVLSVASHIVYLPLFGGINQIYAN